MANVGPNTIITVDMWNQELYRTEFAELGDTSQVGFPGSINLYENPAELMSLAIVENTPARYLKNRNVRSNYFSSFFSNANTSWKITDGFGNQLNLYDTLLENGRLNYDKSLGEIYTSLYGIYLIYGEMIIPQAPSNNQRHALAIYKDGSPYAYKEVAYQYIAGTSIYLQVHTISLFQPSTWTFYWRGSTLPNPDTTIRFGYAQFVGDTDANDVQCGAI